MTKRLKLSELTGPQLIKKLRTGEVKSDTYENFEKFIKEMYSKQL